MRKKRIVRYKEEGDKQLKKYKQMVEFLKTQKKQLKQEWDHREQDLLKAIEELKQGREKLSGVGESVKSGEMGAGIGKKGTRIGAEERN